MDPAGCEDRPAVSGSFPTTHWSAIVAAGQGTSTPADLALAELCRTYWYPIYAFARRKGHQPADAQDLAQLFFVHLIKTRLVRKADPQRGRFRSFLLGCFSAFQGSDKECAEARKWAGVQLMPAMDLERAERRLAGDGCSAATPEQLFDRHWAVAVLDAALGRLEADMRTSGRSDVFQGLLPFLQGEDDRPGYAAVAEQLHTTVGTIKVSVHRLRRRYRELVRETVLQTLNYPLDVDDELAHLMAALRNSSAPR